MIFRLGRNNMSAIVEEGSCIEDSEKANRIGESEKKLEEAEMKLEQYISKQKIDETETIVSVKDLSIYFGLPLIACIIIIFITISNIIFPVKALLIGIIIGVFALFDKGRKKINLEDQGATPERENMSAIVEEGSCIEDSEKAKRLEELERKLKEAEMKLEQNTLKQKLDETYSIINVKNLMTKEHMNFWLPLIACIIIISISISNIVFLVKALLIGIIIGVFALFDKGRKKINLEAQDATPEKTNADLITQTSSTRTSAKTKDTRSKPKSIRKRKNIGVFREVKKVFILPGILLLLSLPCVGYEIYQQRCEEAKMEEIRLKEMKERKARRSASGSGIGDSLGQFLRGFFDSSQSDTSNNNYGARHNSNDVSLFPDLSQPRMQSAYCTSCSGKGIYEVIHGDGSRSERRCRNCGGSGEVRR